MTAPTCPYCGATSVLVTGTDIYPWRPDLAQKQFYSCPKCEKVYVGCHPGTTNPLGRLADAKLRVAKQHAHAVFDPLWERKMERDGLGKGEARGRAYAWLAKELRIDPKDCHIGMMDVDTCMKVVVICRPYARGR